MEQVTSEYAELIAYEDEDGTDENGHLMIRTWSECSKCGQKIYRVVDKCPSCGATFGKVGGCL